MIAILLLSVAAATPENATLAVCRPELARRAGGDIQSINIAQTRKVGRTTELRGQMTVFVGMGRPAPGSASTHHLIRATYHYSCRVRSGKVRSIALGQGD